MSMSFFQGTTTGSQNPSLFPNTGTTGSIFGNQPKTTTTSSSFFPNPSSTTTPSTTQNFFAKPDTTSTSNLFQTFGKPSTTTTTGSQPTQSGGFFSTSINPNPQPTFSGFGQQSTAPTQQIGSMTQLSNKKEIERQEVISIIYNYIMSVSAQSPSTNFKTIVYNRIPPNQQNLLRAFQEYRQKQRTIDGKEEIFVDYNLWNSALQQNPNSNLYYPFQINGPKSLLQRVQHSGTMQRYIFEYIIDYQKKINACRHTYDHEIQNALADGKRKLATIKRSQVNVISKIEKLAMHFKRVEKEYNLESGLINKFNQIKNNLVENEGLIQHIEDISSKTSFINTFDRREEKEVLTREKFQQNLQYFKELKNVFDTTYETLNADFGMLSFIKSEMENRKYKLNN